MLTKIINYLKLLRLRRTIPYIKITTISSFWYSINCPSYESIGKSRLIVKMQSKKDAVYELFKVERAWGVDWCWITYKFVRYASFLDTQKYPRYS